MFFRNKVRVDQYQGADATGLEEKIKQHVENDPGSNEDSDIPKGYVSIWMEIVNMFALKLRQHMLFLKLSVGHFFVLIELMIFISIESAHH